MSSREYGGSGVVTTKRSTTTSSSSSVTRARSEGSRRLTKKFYDWKCACGNFKCRFLGEPELVADCYCQSCVACAMYCEDRGGRGNLDRSPAVVPCVESVYFAWRQIYFSDPDASDKLEFLKVGDDGKNLRSCTVCCRTLFGTSSGTGVIPVNRRFLKHADGTPYVRDDAVRINAKFAAEPEEVPRPHYQELPVMMAFKLMCIRAFGSRRCPIGNNERIVKIQQSMVHIVIPITWFEFDEEDDHRRLVGGGGGQRRGGRKQNRRLDNGRSSSGGLASSVNPSARNVVVNNSARNLNNSSARSLNGDYHNRDFDNRDYNRTRDYANRDYNNTRDYNNREYNNTRDYNNRNYNDTRDYDSRDYDTRGDY